MAASSLIPQGVLAKEQSNYIWLSLGGVLASRPPVLSPSRSPEAKCCPSEVGLEEWKLAGTLPFPWVSFLPLPSSLSPSSLPFPSPLPLFTPTLWRGLCASQMWEEPG